MAERPVVEKRPEKSDGAKGPQIGSNARKGKGRWRLALTHQAPDSVRRLQTALHAKAKGDPEYRFYTLSDKVWREDVLRAAWRAVRRNGEVCGVDGETFEYIKEQGVDRWLGKLAKELRENTYPAARGAAGADPEEAAGEVPPVGHTVHPGQSGAASGDAGADAHL